MYKLCKFLTISLCSLSLKNGLAASYDTLPQGVNTIVFKQVMTSKIESKYNAQGNEGTLDLKEEFTSNRLSDISNVVDSYFKELREISPEAYNNFSLGEFSADISAEVTAQGIGLGYGITKYLTVYAAVPYYHIKTDVQFSQTKQSNLADIQQSIKSAEPTSALGKFVQDLTLQLPNTNAELLQSLVVNYYGYKPIGKWERDSLGDSEVGFVYRLTDLPNSGLAISSGIVLPTGISDDADSLQDVSTGDGQYDAFIEADTGFSLLDDNFVFDLKARFTYQFESEKEVRTFEDSVLPLAKTKSLFRQKLGNKSDISASLTLNPLIWFYASGGLTYSRTGQTEYKNINNQKIKNALESNTSSHSQWLKLGIGISTIKSYELRKFDIPFDIGITAYRLLNAKNAMNYDRIDLDLKLYF